MNMLPLHALFAAALLSACALLAQPAHAADAPATAAAEDCVQLGQDQQIIRAGADRDVLLRNGQDHYVVHFADDCTRASHSRRLSLRTGDDEGRICSAGASVLRTDSGSCSITRIEAIDAAAFKQKVRQRSR